MPMKKNNNILKDIMEEDEEEGETKNNKVPSCIICIGSTGCGKSATISKYTKLPISSNAGTNRVTQKCSMYHRPNDTFAWIDTVGLDDAQFDDEDTFKDILRFIDDNYMTSVKAIIWNINPNVRCDRLLTSQAKLINKFSPKDVWNNVIIIAKQSMSPEDDCRGALTAALDFNSVANTQILGYRFMNDETFTSKQRAKMQEDASTREAFNVYTDDEVIGAIQNALDIIREPIQVVFRTSKCLDCSQRGDERLFSKYCHMQSHNIHTGISEECHPGNLEPYHSEISLSYNHPGRLLNLRAFGGKRFTCCYKAANKRGCIARWQCCGGLPKGIGCRTRHSCCKNDIALAEQGDGGCQKRYACCRGRMEDKGCTEVCKKCERLWGTPTENCFVKKHNLQACDADAFTNNGLDEFSDRVSDDEGSEDNYILQRDNKIPDVILIHVF